MTSFEGIQDSAIANNVAPSSSDVRMVGRQIISSQDAECYVATCESVCTKPHIDPDHSAIECPAVLIAGDQDKISPLPQSEELKGLLGGGNKNVTVEVVHSGHLQVLADAEGVEEAMEKLLVTL